MSIALVNECYRRACEARRSAEMTSMPSQKTHFLEMEQRWLRAAESVMSKSSGKTKDQRGEPKNVPRGRRTKFTPERIEQIRELKALGKSRDEIASLLGVTVGTLQVTCSKLGISLRRPRLKPQVDLPKQEVPATGTVVADPTMVDPVRFAFEDVDEVLRVTRQEDLAGSRPSQFGGQEGSSANFALAIEYRGRKRALPLPLSKEIIATLALEAQVREMSLGQLLGAMIGAAMARGLPQLLDAPEKAA